MQHSLTQGPITKNILLFALPLGVTGIWLSVPTLGTADAHRLGCYLKKRTLKYPLLQSVLLARQQRGILFFLGFEVIRAGAYSPTAGTFCIVQRSFWTSTLPMWVGSSPRRRKSVCWAVTVCHWGRAAPLGSPVLAKLVR